MILLLMRWLTGMWLGAPRWTWFLPGASFGFILGFSWRHRRDLL